jgi:hypothetical protein
MPRLDIKINYMSGCKAYHNKKLSNNNNASSCKHPCLNYIQLTTIFAKCDASDASNQYNLNKVIIAEIIIRFVSFT